MSKLWNGYDGCVYFGCDKSRTFYKIGRSNDPARRQDEIRHMNPTFTIFFNFLSKNSAKDEKKLHEFFASKRVYGEWFALNYDNIRAAVRLMTADGATWLEHINEDYSDFEIEQMIHCAMNGKDYGDDLVTRKVLSGEWECPYCFEFGCDMKKCREKTA